MMEGSASSKSLYAADLNPHSVLSLRMLEGNRVGEFDIRPFTRPASPDSLRAANSQR